MYQTISFIIIGGLNTLHIGTTGTVVPANGHNESGRLNIGIRGSLISESADSDGNNVDEDPCTNDIGLAITMLQHQIIENNKLAKELEVYLCKICLVNYVNIIITPCHHATCDSCMEVFINLYINNSNSRKTCPFCNTFMQHVGKMYFP